MGQCSGRYCRYFKQVCLPICMRREYLGTPRNSSFIERGPCRGDHAFFHVVSLACLLMLVLYSFFIIPVAHFPWSEALQTIKITRPDLQCDELIISHVLDPGNSTQAIFERTKSRSFHGHILIKISCALLVVYLSTPPAQSFVFARIL